MKYIKVIDEIVCLGNVKNVFSLQAIQETISSFVVNCQSKCNTFKVNAMVLRLLWNYHKNDLTLQYKTTIKVRNYDDCA